MLLIQPVPISTALGLKDRTLYQGAPRLLWEKRILNRPPAGMCFICFSAAKGSDGLWLGIIGVILDTTYVRPTSSLRGSKLGSEPSTEDGDFSGRSNTISSSTMPLVFTAFPTRFELGTTMLTLISEPIEATSKPSPARENFSCLLLKSESHLSPAIEILCVFLHFLIVLFSEKYSMEYVAEFPFSLYDRDTLTITTAKSGKSVSTESSSVEPMIFVDNLNLSQTIFLLGFLLESPQEA